MQNLVVDYSLHLIFITSILGTNLQVVPICYVALSPPDPSSKLLYTHSVQL